MSESCMRGKQDAATFKAVPRKQEAGGSNRLNRRAQPVSDRPGGHVRRHRLIYGREQYGQLRKRRSRNSRVHSESCQAGKMKRGKFEIKRALPGSAAWSSRRRMMAVLRGTDSANLEL